MDKQDARVFQEYRIRTGAHLAAIDYIVTRLFSLATVSLSNENFERVLQGWEEGINQETIPGVDAAQSDLLTAEIRDQLLRLLSGVKEDRQAILERMGS